MEDKGINRLERNLITFLKLFQNRPSHLAKYLLENDSFSDNFKNNVINSDKLDEFSLKYSQGELPTIYFLNFKEMLKFYENISNELNIDKLDNDKISDKLNDRLDECIKHEKYEEAIKIRDFMIQNNIKRKI
jgi:hypothetical protein